MSCSHPFDQLLWAPWGRNIINRDVINEATIKCTACDRIIYSDKSEKFFVDFRNQVFFDQTGEDPHVWRDMLYHELRVGDSVVYPAMSGSSAQIKMGEILEICPQRKSEPWTASEIVRFRARGRVGEPWSMKIQPLLASRWTSYAWRGEDKPRAVTLFTNAGSVVRIQND